MPIIDYIDAPNRDIYLSIDTVGASLHPIDIYREARTLRRTNESLRGFKPFLTAKGYDSKGSGKYTERYVICVDGARIVPYDVSQVLTITGVIITDDGQEGIACFDRGPLSATTRVDINYVPPQVEVVTVSSGSGLSPDERAKLLSLPSAVTTAQEITNSLENARIPVNVKEINGAAVIGSGIETDQWRGQGV